MKVLLLSIGLIVLTLSPAIATTWLVLPDGSGDFPTLLDAVAGAAAGDVIELGNGVFAGDGNRDIEVGQALTLRSQSGDPAACVIDCEGNAAEPHRALALRGAQASVTIEGIGFRNGYADGSNLEDGWGGAVLCAEASAAAFFDCRFENCTAFHVGGAIGEDRCADFLVEGCDFVACASGDDGGAVGAAYAGEFAMRQCRVESTEILDGNGAAVYLELEHPNTIARVEDCEFLDNGVGGLYVGSSPCVIRRCQFLRNAQGGARLYGGLVSGLIEDSVFASNTGGCALELSAFIPDDQTPGVKVFRCLFAENSGGSSTVRLWNVPGWIADCTFWGNQAPQTVFLRAEPSFSFDWAGLLERVIIEPGAATEVIHCEDNPHPFAIHCSDLVGGWTGCAADWLGVEGNIDADPMFCDPAAGDFTLHASSPCYAINSGCGTMGAYDVGCGSTGVDDASFSAIKALY